MIVAMKKQSTLALTLVAVVSMGVIMPAGNALAHTVTTKGSTTTVVSHTSSGVTTTTYTRTTTKYTKMSTTTRPTTTTTQKRTTVKAAPATRQSNPTSKPASYISNMPSLINAERKKAGLPALVLNKRLNESAAAKCAHAQTKQYFAHNAPDGTKWYSFIQARTTYKTSGENIAYGYRDAAATVQAWMNSTGHRRAILDTKFTDVGYAVCQSEKYPNYVVQHFISK